MSFGVMNATMFATPSNKKRPREEDDVLLRCSTHSEKKARPTTVSGDDRDSWLHHDSVLSTPISQVREQPKYDSDDEGYSMVSEPGSPQDISMDSDEEAQDDHFSMLRNSLSAGNAPPPRWKHLMQANRIPTPAISSHGNARLMQLRTLSKQHVRQRHPQENSSEHLDVPSPIDEDEVPTPPSAAEAAGSQLSMLSVSDVDMDAIDSIPTISIELARPTRSDSAHQHDHDFDSAVDEPLDSGPENLIVRKQRQRSGALSHGDSPVRAGPSNASARRGFSMGFRADCEKCRLRIPGHMNHFLS